MIAPETTMRRAFRAGVARVIESTRPVQQERLVKRVVRVYENGAGQRQPRAK